MESDNSSTESQVLANRLRGEKGSERDAPSQWSQSRRQFTAGRPTNDQVRDFLRLRRDVEGKQTNTLGNRRVDGDPGRVGDGRLGSEPPDNIRQMRFRGRVSESQTDGDRAWTRRFGTDNANRGDRTPRLDENGPRDGRMSRRSDGDPKRQIDGPGKLDRDFGDRKFVDRRYDDWRKNARRGEHGVGGDHRDRSGRWKDGDRFIAAHRIRDHWKGHKDFDDVPFRGGWWKGRHGHRRHWDHWDRFSIHYHRPFYWWSWCPAPRLTAWFAFGWPTPYYWDYGPGEYIYCYDNVIYVNGVWFRPAPLYYEQTLVLAQRAPDWTPEQAAEAEWLPLGVFAIARDGVADTNLLVQLAVTKDGVIGGTVFNQLTGATYAIEGTVDKDTQRAVWSYVDETDAIIAMETGIYNLTQPEATGLIHYGPDDIQVIELVRLQEPSVGMSTSGASGPVAPTEVP